MNKEISFESYLRDLLTPIIDQAVEKALLRHQFYQPESTQPSAPDLMDIKMTAAYLQLSVPTIYGYVHRRTIPNYKRGQRLYFKKADLDQWITAGRRMTIDEIKESALASLDRRSRR